MNTPSGLTRGERADQALRSAIMWRRTWLALSGVYYRRAAAFFVRERALEWRRLSGRGEAVWECPCEVCLGGVSLGRGRPGGSPGSH